MHLPREAMLNWARRLERWFKKNQGLAARRGQGTVEYILLLGAVIGGLTIAKQAVVKPMNDFLGTYVKGFSNVANPNSSASTGGKPLFKYYTTDQTNPQKDAEIRVK